MTDKILQDRELLELAAKAAGYAVRWHGVWQRFVHEGPHNITNPPSPAWQRLVWIPLDDDGDALRLAVKLNLDILQDPVSAKSNAVEVVANMEGAEHQPWAWEIRAPDPLAATRRAIVRAAAAIGAAK